MLDWLHFQEGEWNVYIIVKMILGFLLTILLIFSVILKRRGTTPNKMLLIYILCLACAGGLGFSGGELVFG
jgi:LytS/YehU family sensor histidine kinase